MRDIATLRWPISCALMLASATAAVAHPHIFVDVQARIFFDDAGRISGIHNSWTFDDAYSAWAIQGLDADHDGKITRQELQPMANDNMKGLADYNYYTFAGEGSSTLTVGRGVNATIDYQNGRTTLNFDLPFDPPRPIAKALEIAIDDPQYYVAMTLAGDGAVQFVNAPKNCTFAIEKGRTMPDDVANQLYALPADVTKLPPALEEALRGVQGGILINCPGGSATGVSTNSATEIFPSTAAPTALEAANEVGTATAAAGAREQQGLGDRALWWLTGSAVALALAGGAILLFRVRRRSS